MNDETETDEPVVVVATPLCCPRCLAKTTGERHDSWDARCDTEHGTVEIVLDEYRCSTCHCRFWL